jgi:hypothetical protein
MTYKSSVEKSELLLDSFYLEYEKDDPFQPIRNEDDQSVRIDQLMRIRDENSEGENSELENSENSENSEDSHHQEENLTETAPPAESPTEVQSVGGNLTPSSADSSQPVRVDQVASLHAVEKTLVVSANQGDDRFILVSDPESDDQANDQSDDQSDNRLISEENNSLILNYSRSKIRHDYKQLHHKGFVKSAKIESIEAVGHGLVILKIFEQVINDPQAKE